MLPITTNQKIANPTHTLNKHIKIAMDKVLQPLNLVVHILFELLGTIL